jgi:hypothetical protein
MFSRNEIAAIQVAIQDAARLRSETDALRAEVEALRADVDALKARADRPVLGVNGGRKASVPGSKLPAKATLNG